MTGRGLLFLILLNSVMLAELAPGDTTNLTERIPDPGKAFRWGLIPGGGQVYNHRWLKAVFFVGIEAYYINRFLSNRDLYTDYTEDAPLQRHRYLEKRNKYAWWMVLAYVTGMLDAYIDAHLQTFPADTISTSDFEEKMEDK